MELVEIDAVGSEVRERTIELLDHLAGRPAGPSIEKAVVLVPELGRDHPLAALAADRAADERFREPVAVALGGVDEVDALVLRVRKEPLDVLEVEGPSPFAAELPRPEPHHRNDEIGRAQGAVFHRPDLPTLMTGW